MTRPLALLLGALMMSCSSSGEEGATTDGGQDAVDSAAGGDGAAGDAVPDGLVPDGPAPDGGADARTDGGVDASGPAIKTVFLILMENHSWVDIKGNAAAPYINKTLLPLGASAENMQNIIHPSEPNYIWLEAGDNLGVTDDNGPSANHQATKDHLVAYLDKAGVSWRSWQEDITGTVCPLSSVAKYAPKHNPMIFFDDVTNTNSPTSKNCIEHMRPFTEFAPALTAGTVARYNFITPNLCNDMHDCSIGTGDSWLAKVVPEILASKAYLDGGVIFITWDETEGTGKTFGMIALSPLAKKGYTNTIKYTHSSTLRTVQEIFGVKPLLRDAAKATSLSDFFTTYP